MFSWHQRIIPGTLVVELQLQAEVRHRVELLSARYYECNQSAAMSDQQSGRQFKRVNIRHLNEINMYLAILLKENGNSKNILRLINNL